MSDRLFGAAFAVLGGAMLFLSTSIASPFPDSGDPGAALVPQALGGVMVFLGAILALRSPKIVVDEDRARSSKLESDTAEPSEAFPPPVLWRRVALLACLVVYVALFEPLGFSLASALFLGATTILLGEFTLVEITRKVAVALAVVLVVGFLLNGLLGQSVQGVWIG